MKTENLIKACESFDQFLAQLRQAHNDAVDSGNDFAEIAVVSLVEEAAKMQLRLARVKDAASR